MTKWKKLKSADEEDYKRIATALYNKYGDEIQDKESFNEAFDDYFKERPDKVEDEKWRRNVYRFYTGDRKGARGIPTQVKKRVQNRQERIERGEISQQIKTKRKVKEKKSFSFDYVGRNKTKTVFARKIMTKRGVRYIDSKGRYVSVKK